MQNGLRSVRPIRYFPWHGGVPPTGPTLLKSVITKQSVSGDAVKALNARCLLFLPVPASGDEWIVAEVIRDEFATERNTQNTIDATVRTI